MLCVLVVGIHAYATVCKRSGGRRWGNLPCTTWSLSSDCSLRTGTGRGPIHAAAHTPLSTPPKHSLSVSVKDTSTTDPAVSTLFAVSQSELSTSSVVSFLLSLYSFLHSSYPPNQFHPPMRALSCFNNKHLRNRKR